MTSSEGEREPKILFRIPFTIYWVGRLPKKDSCSGYKYFAIFKRTFCGDDIFNNVYEDKHHGWRMM